MEGFTLKHGTWKYYDPNSGIITKTEKWFLDKPATGDSKNDDDLKPLDVTDNSTKKDTAVKKGMTKPQAVLDYEKKNSGKKKIKVRDGSTSY